jgi:hypothetical protein
MCTKPIIYYDQPSLTQGKNMNPIPIIPSILTVTAKLTDDITPELNIEENKSIASLIENTEEKPDDSENSN